MNNTQKLDKIKHSGSWTVPKAPCLVDKKRLAWWIKAPHLVGKAPHLVGKAPHLVGKAPHLVGKAPHLVGKKRFSKSTHFNCTY